MHGVVVFPDTDWEAYSCYWLIVNKELFLLRPGEEPPEDRNGAVTLASFADYFNHGDGAVHGTLCFSLPYSREITHFLTPVLLSAARSNSAVNDNYQALWCCLA